MSEQKHFTYDATIKIHHSPKEITIQDVIFLTPARVKALVDGQEREYMVGVDIINRVAYDEQGKSFISDTLFNHLDEVNSLPEDFFGASSEIYEKIGEAEKELGKFNQETGDYNG